MKILYFDYLTYDSNINIQNGIALSNLAKHTWRDFSRELRKNKTKCDICSRAINPPQIPYLESHECLGLGIRDNTIIAYILEIKCLCHNCHKLQHFQFVDIQVENGKLPSSYPKEQYEHYQTVTNDYKSTEEELKQFAFLKNIIIENILIQEHPNLYDLYKKGQFKICLLDNYNGISTAKMKKYLASNNLLYEEIPSLNPKNITHSIYSLLK